MNLGQIERTTQDFKRAVQLDANYAEAFYWRDTSFKLLGNTTEAEADFKKYARANASKIAWQS